MRSKEYDFPKMDDSFLIPARTIRIPMPPGAAVPAQEDGRGGVIQSLAAAAEPIHAAGD